MAKHEFQTEVSQLLHLIIHSLYSHKEIFLRELISNGSDAIDKLKFLTISDDNYKKVDFDPRLDLSFVEGETPTLTITDSGIGMNETDLEDHLGKIANSGTKNFVQNMSGDEKKDSNMIGQFGVGFYSAFMVADKVEVTSKKAGEDKAFKWVSDGKGQYEISEAEKDGHGTEIVLYLNDEGKEYANRWQIQQIIKKYSNHISSPIFMHYESVKTEGEGDDKVETKEQVVEQINSGSAIWKRSKSEITDEDYKEFYKTIHHGEEDPLMYVHTQAEGMLDYSTLFYIPKKAPFDLFRADYEAGVKLYVKRVFITDDEKELMPTYLRFVKGVIDSEDLPLNVSREILQQNKVLAKIKSSSVKKILGELENTLKKDRDKYVEFITEYGIPMKEGLYQDFENKDQLMELVMFKSTKNDGRSTFAEYVDRMGTDQKAIYYITGGKEDNLRTSPLLEMYAKKDVEVLVLDDEIDEIVLSTIPKYKDFDLKSVNRSDAAEDLKTEDDKEQEKELEPIVKKIKDALGDVVKDVKASTRLSDSPSCIVADQNDPTVQMQGILKAMGQGGGDAIKPILEINPNNEIVKKLSTVEDADSISDISNLLLDQALILEGAELKSPAEFVKRLNRVMGKSL